ncbi:hypothetical protein [Lentilactobacillus rapi]|uniref:hypothetical protein n=1 Tax=Lentilactobacillus rapi TaxID=481723 RepID=UPI001FB4A3BF|nr:hypothetical protein [Lentilactobacillus rapi]
MTDSTRYSLPIDTDFNKFMDLDRAFSVTHIPVENGKKIIGIQFAFICVHSECQSEKGTAK